MPSRSVITRAVDTAILSATVDRDAAREPLDERVRFVREDLQRVIDLYKATGASESVRKSVEDAMEQWIKGQDIERALVALRLSDRLLGSERKTFRDSGGAAEAMN